ncbi:DNA polymerase epsilon subunit 2 [Tetrabaena socialis]|uniref:DNA polymerase II subunit 2 n=1 Tax=Tetrabaena socialis TaxID=47790 RepID=A0A2J7ZRY9_9CHLO|nr:DNA polymerase epsilon subunit 2 [Tetrabaena socialis]|eukprot:PNH03039.1 DNA polymerase epsilon subunit 2 [Tetrabaena socialis]
MSFALKKAIKKELLASDWAGKVEETAVAALAVILEEHHGGQVAALHDILKHCNSDLSADGKITVQTVQAAAAPSGLAQQVELVEFTDAFSVPHLVFDPVQRKLHLDTKPCAIHATSDVRRVARHAEPNPHGTTALPHCLQAKHQLYLQRLLIIQQRLQRSRMFQQNNMLLPNSIHMGGSVQVRGALCGTAFVFACPVYPPHPAPNPQRPAGFSGVPTPPGVFVLMGNFHSRAGAAGGGSGRGGSGRGGGGGDSMLSGYDIDYGVMRELFGQLAALIDQYPVLKVGAKPFKAESRFVFVPGPDDPGPGPILPQPPLPRSLTAELRRVLGPSQRQPQQVQQRQVQAQKAGGKAGGKQPAKVRQPRAPKQKAAQGGKGRQAVLRVEARGPVEGAEDPDREGGEGGEDVVMRDGEAEEGDGAARQPQAAKAAAKAAPRQGTLAQAWARQPRGGGGGGGAEGGGGGGGGAGGGGEEDEDMDGEEPDEGKAVARRRQKQQARKRRAVVDEEEEGGGEEGGAAPRTWLDDDDEGGLLDEDE